MPNRRGAAMGAYRDRIRARNARADRVTADTLKQAGWSNSWIEGVRRWHHKTLPAHFKTLAQAKAIYAEYQNRLT